MGETASSQPRLPPGRLLIPFPLCCIMVGIINQAMHPGAARPIAASLQPATVMGSLRCSGHTAQHEIALVENNPLGKSWVCVMFFLSCIFSAVTVIFLYFFLPYLKLVIFKI